MPSDTPSDISNHADQGARPADDPDTGTIDETTHGISEDDVAPDGFAALGLRPELLAALTPPRVRGAHADPARGDPPPLAGRDLLGQAATGTGKTAAFALPLLERISGGHRAPGAPGAGARAHPRARDAGVRGHLQVRPTLGATVVPDLRRPAHRPAARRAAPRRARGGGHPGPGARPHPARQPRLDEVEVVVLDEADEMLDMGFADDLEAILEATARPTRQTVLFSATMPPRIDAIARRHLHDPVRVRIAAGRPRPGEPPLVRQRAYVVPRSHKAAALGRILDVEAPGAAIVFCRTRGEVDQLTETLNGRGYRAEALHGGHGPGPARPGDGAPAQRHRRAAGGHRRGGPGLDIDQLTHVVNYDVPSAPESYVHRIGRVGRAGREGVAITLAEPRERRLLGNIERLTRQEITVEKVPSVADLRARQLELTEASLRDVLAEGDLEGFASVVSTLAEDFDVAQIAQAALKLAYDASGATLDEVEIPDLVAPRPAGHATRVTAPAAIASRVVGPEAREVRRARATR
jgi:ATP-dependent RNA helicase DeaD